MGSGCRAKVMAKQDEMRFFQHRIREHERFFRRELGVVDPMHGFDVEHGFRNRKIIYKDLEK